MQHDMPKPSFWFWFLSWRNTKVKAQTERWRHKQKDEDTNRKMKTQTQIWKHKHKDEDTNTKMKTQTQRWRHKHKDENTNTKMKTQTPCYHLVILLSPYFMFITVRLVVFKTYIYNFVCLMLELCSYKLGFGCDWLSRNLISASCFPGSFKTTIISASWRSVVKWEQ